ncbi:MAG: geranylgeranylglycerol-phosphate geranylgeranyltransferase [Polaribacter sp.]|uniref:geranylgeranylglycerol-phosphate geranylgeranyltransferase n=1 Tax=Polaribacter sp. TaxID=1920175 RepID=UPI002F354591
MVLLTMILTKYALLEPIVHPKFLTNYQFLFFSISILFITAGGYIINDIFDVKTDKINKPDKVFITSKFSKKQGWIFYILLSLIGLVIGIYLSINRNSEPSIYIYILCVIGIFFYSYYFKKHSILGNLIVSFLCGITIFLNFLFHSEYTSRGVGSGILVYYSILFYSSFAFLTTLIREIIKDIEDIDGDLKIKAKTLPILFGRKRASKIVFFFSAVLLISLVFVLKQLIIEPLFLGYGVIFILLPLGYFMYKLLSAEKKKDFSKLSSLMKIIMLFGILSMLLFTIPS